MYEEIKIHPHMDEKELLKLVSDPRNTIVADDEPKLFAPRYRAILYKYLENHALAEKNQELLFESGNNNILVFYISHWSLSKDCEAKLFLIEWRIYLKSYISRGSLVDPQNEILLFETANARMFRMLYLEKYGLHNRNAEAQLFQPEYIAELQLYIESKHRLFKEFEDILKEEHPKLYSVYRKYNPNQDTPPKV